MFPLADIHYSSGMFLGSICSTAISSSYNVQTREIFRHFLLSLDCATAQMKLNFWLGLSGKQGQNPCFWPPAVYQDLSIAPWLACYISHRQIANQVKRKIWNIFLFLGRHPSLVNTPWLWRITYCSNGIWASQKQRNILNISINEKHVNWGSHCIPREDWENSKIAHC